MVIKPFILVINVRLEGVTVGEIRSQSLLEVNQRVNQFFSTEPLFFFTQMMRYGSHCCFLTHW